MMGNVWRKASNTLLGGLFLLAAANVPASSPPQKITLSERVKITSHAIIGTAESVTIVKFKGDDSLSGKIRVVTPQPDSITPTGNMFLVQIKVEEMLYPHGHILPETVQYLVGGGFFDLDSARRNMIGRRFIYLMRRNHVDALDGSGKAFYPSYGWNFCDPLEAKTTIKKLCWARIVAEAKAKQKTVKKQTVGTRKS